MIHIIRQRELMFGDEKKKKKKVDVWLATNILTIFAGE